MKTKFFIWVVFLAVAGVSAQTNSLTSALQKGLFEEEANRNLDAAISNYQSLAAQFDQDRQVAATAIFRLGECYRKLGQTNDAVVQYQRIIREFADQPTLATLSRQNLTGLGSQSAATPAPVVSKAARQEQKRLLEAEIKLAEEQRETVRVQIGIGRVPRDDLVAKEREILQLRRQLAALDDSTDEPMAAAGARPPAVVIDEEETEIRRIQEMIQNSPDLINARIWKDRISTTPLISAAAAGRLRVVTFLLDHGADINIRQGGSILGDYRSGRTALHSAAGAGNRAMVELLLSRGADVNARDSRGQTPLHIAAEDGYQAVADALLAHQADVNAADNSGTTPLMLAVKNGNRKLASALLAFGTNPNLQNNINARNFQEPNAPYGTALHLAVARKDAAMVALLLTNRADVNARSVTNNSPLDLAASAGATEIAAQLIAAGADVNAAAPADGGGGCTPLLRAIEQGHAGMVKLLLEKGANQDTSSKPNAVTPLMLAAFKGDAEITRLLLERGARVDLKDKNGETALYNALKGKNVEVVKLLLAHGANPNERSPNDNSPLLVWMIADKSNPDVVAAFLKAKIDVNATNSAGSTLRAGSTPLHMAVRNGRTDLVEMLLAAGADPNRRDGDGRTPLDYAKEQRNTGPALAELLRQHSALDNLPNWDRIEISRPAANFSASYFWKGTNNWNRFTLLDVLARQYELLQHSTRGAWSSHTTTARDFWNRNPCRFPDLPGVLIRRPSPDGRRWTVLTVDMAKLLQTGDCSMDQPLQWGDVIEIPETDHPVNETWYGLTAVERDALLKCVSRRITISIKGTNAALVLLPVYGRADRADEGFDVTPASFMLRSVLDQSGLLRASSDLSRVKVTRRDPKTGKKLEWTLNCSGNNAPDLWLRDGDVIEVPEK